MTPTWDILRQLRLQGRVPKVVIVTDDPTMPLREESILVIDHEPGAPMPVALLEGLDVIFWFKRCFNASKAFKLISARGVKVKRAQAYCGCLYTINTSVFPCEKVEELCDWTNGGA